MNIRIAILAAYASALVSAANPAYAGEPIPGVDVNLNCKGPIQCKTVKATAAKPAFQNNQQQKAGPGTTKAAIFDRWGNSKK